MGQALECSLVTDARRSALTIEVERARLERKMGEQILRRGGL